VVKEDREDPVSRLFTTFMKAQINFSSFTMSRSAWICPLLLYHVQIPLGPFILDVNVVKEERKDLENLDIVK